MTYRNGTYVAFHAEGETDPTKSDMRYYRLLEAWKVRDPSEFTFVNSHDKTSAVRDSSKKATLRASIVTRLRNSKNMILVVGSTTRQDTDWVPFEIEYAIDTCGIPLIAAYPGYDWISAPNELRSLWPTTLATRINNATARVIHVPFKKEPLADAVSQFSHSKPPSSAVSYYSDEAYRTWGLK